MLRFRPADGHERCHHAKAAAITARFHQYLRACIDGESHKRCVDRESVVAAVHHSFWVSKGGRRERRTEKARQRSKAAPPPSPLQGRCSTLDREGAARSASRCVLSDAEPSEAESKDLYSRN